jgi:Leucine-rich repeat (LRR) protein
MQLKVISLLILVASLGTQCGVTTDAVSTNSNSSNTATTNQTSNTTTSENNINDKNEWYYIPGSEGYVAFWAEKGFGEAIGGETDYSKIKNVTILMDLEHKVLPNNLNKLTNLESISVRRSSKDKNGAAIDNRLKMDVSSLLSIKTLKRISLINIEPDFGASSASSNLEELSMSNCKVNGMPKFVATSSLKDISFYYSEVSKESFGTLPISLKNVMYSDITDEQEIELVSHIGIDQLYPNRRNIPKKFSFSTEDYTVDQLLENKDKVMRLFLFLDSTAGEYAKIVTSFPNLEHLHLLENPANEGTGNVYKTYVLPEEVYSCEKLTYLELRSDRMEEINGDLSSLKKLKVLKLDGPLTKLAPFKIDGLEKLELNVLFNHRSHDRSPVIELMYYEKVGNEVMSTKQANLDMVLKNHPNLKELRIWGNSGFGLINPFSIESLKDCTKLELIEIGQFKMPNFPDFVLNNPNLEALLFDKTYMSSIPAGISKLTKLTDVFIRTSAKSLPEGLFELPNLNSLSFSGRNIENIDGLFESGALPELKYLFIEQHKVNIEKFKTFKKNRPEVSVKVNFKEL